MLHVHFILLFIAIAIKKQKCAGKMQSSERQVAADRTLSDNFKEKHCSTAQSGCVFCLLLVRYINFIIVSILILFYHLCSDKTTRHSGGQSVGRMARAARRWIITSAGKRRCRTWGTIGLWKGSTSTSKTWPRTRTKQQFWRQFSASSETLNHCSFVCLLWMHDCLCFFVNCYKLSNYKALTPWSPITRTTTTRLLMCHAKRYMEELAAKMNSTQPLQIIRGNFARKLLPRWKILGRIRSCW